MARFPQWRIVGEMPRNNIVARGRQLSRACAGFPGCNLQKSLIAIELLNLHRRKIKFARIFVCLKFNKHKKGVFWKNK
jgi:hypothetical protein